MWVESAFGPFFGFLEGLFSWVSGVTDNTLYPIMFVKYLEIFLPALAAEWTSKCAPTNVIRVYWRSNCMCCCAAGLGAPVMVPRHKGTARSASHVLARLRDFRMAE